MSYECYYFGCVYCPSTNSFITSAVVLTNVTKTHWYQNWTVSCLWGMNMSELITLHIKVQSLRNKLKGLSIIWFIDKLINYLIFCVLDSKAGLLSLWHHEKRWKCFVEVFKCGIFSIAFVYIHWTKDYFQISFLLIVKVIRNFILKKNMHLFFL